MGKVKRSTKGMEPERTSKRLKDLSKGDKGGKGFAGVKEVEGNVEVSRTRGGKAKAGSAGAKEDKAGVKKGSARGIAVSASAKKGNARDTTDSAGAKKGSNGAKGGKKANSGIGEPEKARASKGIESPTSNGALGGKKTQFQRIKLHEEGGRHRIRELLKHMGFDELFWLNWGHSSFEPARRLQEYLRQGVEDRDPKDKLAKFPLEISPGLVAKTWSIPSGSIPFSRFSVPKDQPSFYTQFFSPTRKGSEFTAEQFHGFEGGKKTELQADFEDLLLTLAPIFQAEKPKSWSLQLVNAVAYDLLHLRGMLDLKVEKEWDGRPDWLTQYTEKLNQWVTSLPIVNKTPVGVPILHLFGRLDLLNDDEEEEGTKVTEDPEDLEETAADGVEAALKESVEPTQASTPALKVGGRISREAKGKGVVEEGSNLPPPKASPPLSGEAALELERQEQLKQARWFTECYNPEWNMGTTLFPKGDDGTAAERERVTFPYGTTRYLTGEEEKLGEEYRDKPPLSGMDFELMERFWEKPIETRGQMVSSVIARTFFEHQVQGGIIARLMGHLQLGKGLKGCHLLKNAESELDKLALAARGTEELRIEMETQRKEKEKLSFVVTTKEEELREEKKKVTELEKVIKEQKSKIEGYIKKFSETEQALAQLNGKFDAVVTKEQEKEEELASLSKDHEALKESHESLEKMNAKTLPRLLTRMETLWGGWDATEPRKLNASATALLGDVARAVKELRHLTEAQQAPPTPTLPTGVEDLSLESQGKAGASTSDHGAVIGSEVTSTQEQAQEVAPALGQVQEGAPMMGQVQEDAPVLEQVQGGAVAGSFTSLILQQGGGPTGAMTGAVTDVEGGTSAATNVEEGAGAVTI